MNSYYIAVDAVMAIKCNLFTRFVNVNVYVNIC